MLADQDHQEAAEQAVDPAKVGGAGNTNQACCLRRRKGAQGNADIGKNRVEAGGKVDWLWIFSCGQVQEINLGGRPVHAVGAADADDAEEGQPGQRQKRRQEEKQNSLDAKDQRQALNPAMVGQKAPGFVAGDKGQARQQEQEVQPALWEVSSCKNI